MSVSGLSGSAAASDEQVDHLFAAVYAELRQSAHRMRRLQRGDTLNTTLLVHELYLRFKKSDSARFESTPQFFAYAARALRSIMVDHARSRIAERERISDMTMLAILDAETPALSPNQALALNDALQQLEQDDARAAKVVELHFFAGLSLPEVARHLELTTRTIDRDWRYARAFLQSVLGDSSH
ncbi:MAG: sigma-70 family RNA polymerase sigma factor [Xanthomonadales bacterium]|nr:sigma-70 family RNA polymerase sigma factor [Xanthomonadales bacterium]